MGIISAMNPESGNPDSIYRQYADSAWFSQIIELESDFVSGNIQKIRPQYQQIDILPFNQFNLVFLYKPKNEQLLQGRNKFYTTPELAAFNAANAGLLHLLLKSQPNPDIFKGIFELLEMIDKMPVNQGTPATHLLLKATIHHQLQNFTSALGLYDEALRIEPNNIYALINRGNLNFEIETLHAASEMHAGTIIISQGNNQLREPPETFKEPDYSKAISDYDQAIKLNMENAFAWFNRGNLQLHMGAYHRAIDDFSEAIRHEANLGEAYYNRALTLLYLGENQLACSDLSKAGELGISEAYAVIRRYCSR
jgi:tetratricopeptide (TPR) repeat protein